MFLGKGGCVYVVVDQSLMVLFFFQARFRLLFTTPRSALRSPSWSSKARR